MTTFCIDSYESYLSTLSPKGGKSFLSHTEMRFLPPLTEVIEKQAQPVFCIRIHWFRIQIQHSSLNTDPDPDRIRIKGFDDQKLEKIYVQPKIVIYILLIKKYNWLINRLHKGRPGYRRSLQSSKENIQHIKIWNSSTFFYFCGSFLPSDPDPLTLLNPDPIWFRIQSGSGSGSETQAQASPFRNSSILSFSGSVYCIGTERTGNGGSVTVYEWQWRVYSLQHYLYIFAEK